MSNVFETIVEFNRKAGLLSEPANPKLEASYQIEEALEEYDLTMLSKLLAPTAGTLNPKDASRQIMNVATWEGVPKIPAVKQLDKAIDAVVFAVGNAAKQGLSAKQIEEAINVVMTANMAKLGCPRDELGKLTKPQDFEENYAPEPRLQKIIDKAVS